MRLVFVALAAALIPMEASAYLGPGAGLGMLGSLIAVVGVVLLAVFGLFFIPLRMILKKKRAHPNVDTTDKSD